MKQKNISKQKQQSSNNRRMLKRLKLATIFMPPVIAWFYETLRHSLFSYQLQQDWLGNLLAAIVVFSISFTFAQVVFALIARIQARLVSQNKQLRELNQKVKVMAVTEERSRLSREMHDGLAQLLAYSMMKVDLVETLILTGKKTEALKELELVRKACDDGYNDVREAITGLRADLLDGRDFLTIIDEILNHFSDTNPLAVELNRSGFEGLTTNRESGGLIPPVWTLQIVRVVQEALSNVRKHSSATRVKVNLVLQPGTNLTQPGPKPLFSADSGSVMSSDESSHYRNYNKTASKISASDLDNETLSEIKSDDITAPTLVLEISDNGLGFGHLHQKESSIGSRSHFGLLIMRERMESLGGKFKYGNLHGEEAGAYIRVTLPLKAESTATSEDESDSDLLNSRSNMVA